MNGDSRGKGPPPPGPGGPAGPDTGEPLRALADLGVEPSVGFIPRVRRRIDRRVLGSSLFSLVWQGSALVVRELVEVVFGLVSPNGDGKGGSA